MDQSQLPPGVSLQTGNGNLAKLVIDSPLVSAEFYLHGAHLTQWQPKGHKPVLWMSGQSLFQADKPIRGGVPICFPWFGPRADHPQSPIHGFARLADWQLRGARRDKQGVVSLLLALQDSDTSRAIWPHAFRAEMSFVLGEELTMTLAVHNSGKEPFEFEQALHTYFTVGDVRQATVTGLAGATYIDKTDNLQRKTQGPEPIAITAETDRLYLNTAAATVIKDPSLARRITIRKAGSQSTVVWNPWIAKAKAMPDFGDDGWTSMLCVETVNASDNKVTLRPMQTQSISARISVAKA